VSHSWHDNPETKWKALQRWRADFVSEHGREPKVWIDKCCIDQSNIQCDLACLPVFLSGCKKIVVFCGASYLSRLWCIMEIFTFVQMCRRTDDIEFHILVHEDREWQDSAAVKEAFERFDARECECFLAEDKEQMLQIILGAFGDMSSFNRQVSAMFREADFSKQTSEGYGDELV